MSTLAWKSLRKVTNGKIKAIWPGAELKKFWPWNFVCFQNSIFQSFINRQHRKFCKIRRNFIKTSQKLISVIHLSFTLEISICFDMFEWLILVKSLETLTLKWFMNGRLIQNCLSKIIMSRCSIKFHASKIDHLNVGDRFCRYCHQHHLSDSFSALLFWSNQLDRNDILDQYYRSVLSE